ncbi:MAG: dipeptidase [Patescibacteria group bacterium]
MLQKYLDPLLHLLEIKSVSTQKGYASEMQKARHYLGDLFSSLGFETKILKGKKHDAMFAQLITNHLLPTILIYGHYDVQPPDPLDEWKTDPFKPAIKDGKIWARGATDNKGQFMIHVMAVKRLLETSNKLQVNFKFIIEGEEEIGSISISDLARKYSKNLFICDYIFVSDSEMIAKGAPSIDISLRGLVYTEIFLEGASHDLHSGQFGGVAQNPANILSFLISQLKDQKGHIMIPGFYDEVISPTKDELKDYSVIKTTDKILIKEGGFYKIGGGEAKFSLNERRWSRPTLDVNGMTSGYQGEGSKTIIPASSSAKISMRLVPNQNPDKIFSIFSSYVKKLVPKGIKIKIVQHADSLPYKADTTSPVFDLVKESLKKFFGTGPVFAGVGGTIGFVPTMALALKVPVIMVGFGLPDENLHAPNEHIDLENYFKGIEAMSYFYKNLPKIA